VVLGRSIGIVCDEIAARRRIVVLWATAENGRMTQPFSIPPLEYDFFAPPSIVFGWGRRRELGTLAAKLGRRAFVVSGSRTLENNGELSNLFSLLEQNGVEPVHVASIWHEPEVRDVDLLTADMQEQEPLDTDFVIAIGGGSAIDLAKAAAAMATNREGATVSDYLEGVGRGLKILRPPLALLAMPTTAGTGSEATKNAVISNSQPAFKKSLRSDMMVPRIVFVDPELSVSVPPDVTAHTGMDAITQLVESFISKRARPIPSALCIQGLQLAVPALAEAVRDGNCRAAREAMSHAALLSGIALANSGLGMAHGVAAALGAVCGTRHGLACAVMLPPTLRFNRDFSLSKLAVLGRLICDPNLADDSAAADAFIDRIERLAKEISIPQRLGELGVKREQLSTLVKASYGNSMSGNPRDVSDVDLLPILEAIL
jgi:alcohol dehydrogenase class IV